MTHQEIAVREELAMGLDEIRKLPQPCIHQDALEVHRRTAYGAERLAVHDPQCPACQQHLKAQAPLSSNDAPALIHAIIFYGVFFAVRKLNPYNRMHLDVAMWIAWLAVFAYNFATRTPLKTARNAILILVAIDTVMVYGLFWRRLMQLTFSESALHVVNSFIASLIAVSPIFVAFGIHFFIKRLKTHARADT